MTKNRKHHPQSCIQRLTLPRKDGGRGLIDIVNLHNAQIANLRSYFHNKNTSLHIAIVQNDHKFTPLNLLDKTTKQSNEITISNQNKIEEWAKKSLHGRHYRDLNLPYVDKKASNEWLRRGELFPETEGFIFAIQDQVIETRNYRKHIMKTQNAIDVCRKCNNPLENIQNITGSCKTIVQTEYKHRHDQVANIIHQELALKYNLIKIPRTPYYKYKPELMLENSTHILYFDRTILTDKTTHFNRPDITLVNKIEKTALLIDIAVPNTHNIQSTVAEKITKYTDLKIEVKRMWNLNTVTIVPIVISTTGVIPTMIHDSIKTIGLHKNIYIILQKAVILNTCRIVRKFLQID
ncbi:unnamed protein product [Euphydryas editha]|uniref:Reverse transcriptase n=1 Tax=Euphydryas editha TaxID=104508 RepID=A0AAU9U6R8_EUPED|nr:unnamed protein product [Euphydryas editha]